MIDKLFELAFTIIRAIFRKGDTAEKLIGLLKKYREILVYLSVFFQQADKLFRRVAFAEYGPDDGECQFKKFIYHGLLL